MSLINEALKKAQHQRTGSAMDAPPMPGGAAGAPRRGQSIPTGTLVLLIAGATVVVVISVVATVYFVNRAPDVKIAAAAAVAKPAVAKSASEPSPVIIAPVIVQTPPPVIELPKPQAEVVAAAPAPATPAAASPGTAAPGPESAANTPDTQPAPAAAAAAPPADVGSLTDRIYAFIDKVRVTGIRASDKDSKVLMNDHVYRINDVVDRKLGLHLVKIAADSLTFADANGVTYVKNF